VFDLYCGVGLFTLPLAARGFSLVGVERDPDAVRAARETARALQPGRCTFDGVDLEHPGALERLVAKYGRPMGVIVDPPRRGLPAGLIRELLEAAPPWLIYVSCDGGTFARDAARLGPRYRLEALQGFDLFPQTHHLELVGRFTLRRE
jgi:23S rRNA (uracil1939-C5)-methyltransferase